MATDGQSTHNCNRGIFAIAGWRDLVSKAKEYPPNVISRCKAAQSSSTAAQSPSASMPIPQQTASQKQDQGDVPAGQTSGIKMLAKYSYKANPGSPLGKELTVQQGDKLTNIGKHPENEHWWQAENEDGDQGYVPASYMMVLEEVSSGLPWLQNRQEEEELKPEGNNVFGPPAKGSYKPYQSAYNRAGEVKADTKYYCDVCEKSFNGPQPYSAHMVSKGHREEVELRESM